MKFTPKTANEIAEDGLLPQGTYDIEVLEATDGQSKAGNDMITLKLRVWDANGGERIVYDYLLEAMAKKLRGSADAFGLMRSYEAGTLSASDYEGKTGKAKIGISKSKDPAYPDRNGVLDYIAATMATTTAALRRGLGGGYAGRRSVSDDLSDDIPFSAEWR